MDLYHQIVMDHYHNPRHRGTLEQPDFDTGQFNPSCGDVIGMQGTIADGTLTAIAFTGKGCVISQAAASMLCERALGRPIKELADLSTDDMLNLIQIQLGPTRLKCALLALHALQEGIASYQKEHKKED